DWNNAGLVAQIEERSRFRLLGHRDDVPRILAAFDVATLCSWYGEGFPNVVGEAMACEVPCIVTPIGDSAEIVGDTGIVVPPRDPEALRSGWQQLIALTPESRRGLGVGARQRIAREYELNAIVRRYESLYDELGG